MSDFLLNRRAFTGLGLASAASFVVRDVRADDPPAAEATKPEATKPEDKKPEPKQEEVEQHDNPLPFVDGSFTLVALPDTQVYCERWPDHFYNQTKWIAENKAKHNIAFVTHLGDITNRNTTEQWEVAQRAMATLDGVVPYSLALGNHDCGPRGGATTRDTYLNDYFPVETARKRESLAGLFDETRLDNSFHTFTARGQKFLVLALEWGPRDEPVDWAAKVIADHPDHRVIITTHAYMYYDDTRYDWTIYGKKQTWNPHSYGTAKLAGGTNDGQQLWDKLIAKNQNVFMTLNGHVLQDGLGRLTSTRDSGGDVHQMLVNYQMKKEGGQAYMRLVEFLPDGETVQVKAYSPSLDLYKTDPQNQFTLKLNPGIKV